MKRSILMTVLCLAIGSNAYSQPAQWGAEELASSSGAGVEAFQNEFGFDALKEVNEINVKLRASKNAAVVTLTYSPDGSKKAEYMCHTHGSAIDCH